MKRLLFLALLCVASLATAQTNDFKWIKQQTYTAAGTDTYTATITGVAAYTPGLELKILFTNANTGAATLNINSLGAIALRKNGGTALTSGDLAAGATYRLTFDGTNFQVLGIGGGGGGSPGGSDTQVQFNDGGSFGGDAGFVYNKTTNVGTIGGLNVSGLTASELVATDGSKNLQSLAVATYPSLTELSYVKGLTSAAQTQLGNKWDAATGLTFTGANTFTGTTTNILKGVFNALGTTQTNGAGLWLANTTAAAAGAQQRSPALVFEGQGWKTNATAASQSIKFITDVLPVQGAANPSGYLSTSSSINASAYSEQYRLYSDGDAVLLNRSTTAGRGFAVYDNGGTERGVMKLYPLTHFEVGAASGYPLRLTGGGAYGMLVSTTGNVQINSSTTVSNTAKLLVGGPVNSTVPVLRLDGPVHTNLTASTEHHEVNFALNRTKTFAAGALATQREVLFAGPTYAFASASTLSNAYTVYINKPVAGTNATITNNYSLGTDGNVNFGGDVDLGTSSISGTSRSVSVFGSEANIALNLNPKGSSPVTVGSRYFQLGRTSDGDTFRTITSEGSETDITLDIYSKGTLGWVDVNGTFQVYDINNPTGERASFQPLNYAGLRFDEGNSFFKLKSTPAGGTAADLVIQAGYDTGKSNLYLDVETGGADEGNIGLMTTSVSDWQDMDRGFFEGNAGTAPTDNPASGIFRWVSSEPEGSNMKIRTTGGHFAKPVLQAKVTIAGGATLRSIGSTPQTIIAAPGTGKYINVISASVSYNYNSAVYNFSGTEVPVFKYSGGTGSAFAIPVSVINGSADYNRSLGRFNTDSSQLGGIVAPDNTSFVFTTDDAGDATTGDGDIDIVVYYTIETTNN